MTVDRSALWIPLLQRVTREFPRWAVWKNVESALSGHGDVDSFAPPEDWPAIARTWRAWARESGLGPAIVCRHVPQGPHFVALEPGSPWLVQFDVKMLATFRGFGLMDVPELLELAEMDERGFRRIRPGAEGVLKLVYNGMRPGGRKDEAGLEAKRVVELLRSDPEGVRRGAELFGPARGAVQRAVDAVVAGNWSRSSLVAVEAWSLVRSLAEPQTSLGRLWFGQVTKKRCPILQVIRERDRRLPGDVDAWLEAVRRAPGHTVLP
ncbi:MAG TPA: hypothetical protein VM778_03300 [Gemmatimonadota bacterium]|nr:hypothetical protein [Gemmatimonadota bacterium]